MGWRRIQYRYRCGSFAGKSGLFSLDCLANDFSPLAITDHCLGFGYCISRAIDRWLINWYKHFSCDCGRIGLVCLAGSTYWCRWNNKTDLRYRWRSWRSFIFSAIGWKVIYWIIPVEDWIGQRWSNSGGRGKFWREIWRPQWQRGIIPEQPWYRGSPIPSNR